MIGLIIVLSKSQNLKVKSEFKALIIDDEVEICYLLARILRNRGIEVSTVNSLAEAKSLLSSFAPSVIFLDNHLPDGLGVEFALYVKSLYPDAKVIIISGKETNHELAKRNGALEVIAKPFSSDCIFSLIEKYA